MVNLMAENMICKVKMYTHQTMSVFSEEVNTLWIPTFQYCYFVNMQVKKMTAEWYNLFTV